MADHDLEDADATSTGFTSIPAVGRSLHADEQNARQALIEFLEREVCDSWAVARHMELINLTQDVTVMSQLPSTSVPDHLRFVLVGLARNFKVNKSKREGRGASGDGEAKNEEEHRTNDERSRKRVKPEDITDGGGLGVGDDGGRFTKEPADVSRKSARKAMARFINMTELTLADVFVDHLEEIGGGGREFMHIDADIHHHADDLGPDYEIQETFGACYSLIQTLTERRDLDNVRWCFTLIMFSELIDFIHPAPDGTEVTRARRVGPRILERAETFIKEICGKRRAGEVIQNLNSWCRWGDKLKFLCTKFGEGAIFYLTDHLSEDFLQNKFAFTGDGADKAWATLERLQLEQAGDASGMTQLGRNVREFLIKPFRTKFQRDAGLG